MQEKPKIERMIERALANMTPEYVSPFFCFHKPRRETPYPQEREKKPLINKNKLAVAKSNNAHM